MGIAGSRGSMAADLLAMSPLAATDAVASETQTEAGAGAPSTTCCSGQQWHASRSVCCGWGRRKCQGAVAKPPASQQGSSDGPSVRQGRGAAQRCGTWKLHRPDGQGCGPHHRQNLHRQPDCQPGATPSLLATPVCSPGAKAGPDQAQGEVNMVPQSRVAGFILSWHAAQQPCLVLLPNSRTA